MLIYLSASAHETILAAFSVACLVGKTGEATMADSTLHRQGSRVGKGTLSFFIQMTRNQAEMSILGEHGNMKIITNNKNDKN